MNWTVGQILEQLAPDIGGAGIVLDCNERARNTAIDKYNEITRLLMLETNSHEVRMCLPICGGCVSLDRRIEAIRMARVENRNLTPFSRNFRFLQANTGAFPEHENCVGSLLDMGDGFATHVDPPVPMHLVAYSDQQENAEATITFGYVEPGRQREVFHSLAIVKGTDLANRPHYTAGDPNTPGDAEVVRSVTKSRTKGYVYIWGFNPLTEDMIWLSTMAPDEISAGYRRYKVPGTDPSKSYTLDCVVTLRWIPLYDDRDLSLIQQPDAYKRMAKGLAALESGDDRDYERWRNRAVSLIDKQKLVKEGAASRRLNISIRHGGARIARPKISSTI